MSDIRDIESPEVEEIITPDDFHQEQTQLLSGPSGQAMVADIENFARLDPQMVEKAIANRIQIYKAIRKAIMGTTTKADWVNMDNRPYMGISGRQKYANMFGVEISDMSRERVHGKDNKGEYVRIGYRARFSLYGRSVWEIGIRTTRDQLWAVGKEKRVDAEGKVVLGPDKKPIYDRVDKPLEDVNEGHVEKAAWTNCQGRGFACILGLNGITWEELDEAGIRNEDVQSFGFHGKKTATDAQKGFVQVLMKRYNRTEDDVRKIIGHGLDVLMSADVDKIKAAFEADAKVESASTAQNSRITSDEIKRIREGMTVLGITEEEFKKKFGALPEGLKPVQVKPVLDWLNARADEKA